MFPQLRLTICFARVSWADVACYLLMGETEAPTQASVCVGAEALGHHENRTRECA